MRITDYTTSQQLIYTLNNLQTGLNTAENQLSSGQQLTQSSDNPGQVSMVMNMESQLRTNDQYQGNLNTVNDISQSTYSAVSSLKTVVTNAQSLALSQESNTGVSDTSSAVATLNGYINEAISVANTQNNGEYLFGSNMNNASPISVTYDGSGNATSVTYVGGTSAASSIPVADGQTMSPYSTPAQNQQIVGAINDLISLRNAISGGDSTTIQAATTAMGTDENNVIDQMSQQGALQSQVTALQSLLKSSSTAVDSNISAAADTDVANATMQFQQMQTAYTAAVTAGSKMMSNSLLNYLSTGITG